MPKEKIISQWKKDQSAPFSGWDFSYLKNRMAEEKPSWNYLSIAKRLLRKSKSVLDMGTGGGEIFSSLAPFPEHAIATEGYKPNYLIAKRKLEPLGVRVIKCENSEKTEMPFRNKEFDLVLNRHDAFNIKEVFRTLKEKGAFLTQQVGGGNLEDLIKEFGAVSHYKSLTLNTIKKQAKDAGFVIHEAKQWKGKIEFKDVGALVYYLKAIPWIVEDFNADRNLSQLMKLQNKLDKGKKLVFTEVRFLIHAVK
ncbi:MAG: methyltransferase domain-containing protein [Candidatus Aenigmarchaeota archaeon]|nr:methyltransferase domain-containing protein [Candidatus Aenigmarchaeota archaeon]